MKISVALCTYNGMPFLKGQLDSILGQSMAADEIVICDDGSTDGTIALLQEYRQKHRNILVKQNEERLGFGKNFEQAIKLCTGDLIFLADQDDIWLPQKIKLMAGYMQAHPKILGAYCNGYQIDDNGIVLKDSIWQATFSDEHFPVELGNWQLFPWLAINNNCIIGSSIAFRANTVDSIFNTWLPNEPWHDFLIVLKLSLSGSLSPLPDLLMQYRQHAQQTVGLKGHYERAEKIRFGRAAWNHSNKSFENEEVTTYFAFGLSAMERYEQKLAITEIEKKLFRKHYGMVTRKLKIALKTWLDGMPIGAKKTKLLKHYLKGGEYLRITLKDVLSI